MKTFAKYALGLFLCTLFLSITALIGGCGGGGHGGGGTSTFLTTPSTFAIAGVTYTYEAQARFPSRKAITYTLPKAPSGMVIDSIAGIVSWTPTNADGGTKKITIHATDGTASADQTYTLTVATTTVVASQFITAAAGGTITVAGTGTALDGASIEIPPGSLDTDDTISVAVLSEAPAPLTGQTRIGQPFVLLTNVGLTRSVTLNIPITVNSIPSGLSPADTFIQVLNKSPALLGTGGETFWVPLETKLNGLKIVAEIVAGNVIIDIVSWKLNRAMADTPQFVIDAEAGITVSDINDITAALQEANQTYVNLLHFNDPGKVHVIIYNNLSDHTFVGGKKGIRGLTNPGQPSVILLDRSSFAGSTQKARNVVLHEYFHAVQYTYLGFNFFSRGDPSNNWILEATATFMQDDSLGTQSEAFDIDPFLSEFTVDPLDLQEGETNHQYGAFLFFRFLTTVRATAPNNFDMHAFWSTLPKGAFNNLGGALQALDAYLKTIGGSLAGDYLRFVYALNAYRHDNSLLKGVTSDSHFNITGYFQSSSLRTGHNLILADAEKLDHLSSRTFLVDVSASAGAVTFTIKGSASVTGEVFQKDSPTPFTTFTRAKGTTGDTTVNLVGNQAGKTIIVCVANPQFTDTADNTLTFEASTTGGGTSLPDLTASNLSFGTTTLQAGQITPISFTVNNIGATSSGPFRARLYASTDSTVDTTDTPLAVINISLNFNTLAPGASIPVNANFLAGSQTGTYFLAVIVNDDSAVTETSTTNNVSNAVQVTIR